MASIRRTMGRTNSSGWSEVGFELTRGTLGAVLAEHEAWLKTDQAQGDYVLSYAKVQRMTYAFSDPNTAMAFKLRFR
ncbi:MAG: hypothetical protein EOP83_36445 [Verrucomicrobiaceae bacterium]|nr:MAG: hypothetical protein EOP83_36445 [Verrucomicrobiaceae bacterium]